MRTLSRLTYLSLMLLMMIMNTLRWTKAYPNRSCSSQRHCLNGLKRLRAQKSNQSKSSLAFRGKTNKRLVRAWSPTLAPTKYCKRSQHPKQARLCQITQTVRRWAIRKRHINQAASRRWRLWIKRRRWSNSVLRQRHRSQPWPRTAPRLV